MPPDTVPTGRPSGRASNVRSRVGTALGLVLWLAVALAPPLAEASQATGVPVPLAEYRERLAAAITVLEGREPEAVVMAREVLAPAGNGLVVLLPSGEVVRTQPLIDANHSATEALARLRLARDQLAAAERDDGVARLARLKTVLNRAEFDELYREPSLWERLWEWLRGLLPEREPGQGDQGANLAGEGVAWIVTAVGGLAVAFVLSYWLRGLLAGVVADAEPRRREAAGEDEPMNAADARRNAAALAGAARYRPAVRQLYLAALLHLEERGLLRADRGLTNHEHLAQLRDETLVRGRFQPVMQTFEEVWYGVHEPDADTFRGFQHDVDALTAAERGSRGAEGQTSRGAGE